MGSRESVEGNGGSGMTPTLMATGYTVEPISKLPFLNIITEVLLIQVPAWKQPMSRYMGPHSIPKDRENLPTRGERTLQTHYMQKQ